MIAAVIPCFRVKKFILDVLSKFGPEVDRIYVVDDRCPEGSGEFVRQNCTDGRVRVVFNEQNLGVGGATLRGFALAAEEGADVIVKVDGDGQMDPVLIPAIVRPVLSGQADYAKGNRFYSLRDLEEMPALRLFGNAGLSFLLKAATGYYSIMDPTNGYVAMSGEVFKLLPVEEIDKRFFFESNLLYHLSIARAVVADVPIRARYGDEESNLRISRVLVTFPQKILLCLLRRLFYLYFLRNFNVGSVYLVVGILLTAFGTVFGAWKWFVGIETGSSTPAGTVMVAALPIILGLQLILGFIQFDVSNEPAKPLHGRLQGLGRKDA